MSPSNRATLPVILLLQGLAFPGSAHGELDGQGIYLAQKCNLCHGVSTAGIQSKTSGRLAGRDLVGVVDARGSEFLAAYLRGDAEIDGARHVKQFTGSDEELDALIDWLGEQKKAQ